MSHDTLDWILAIAAIAGLAGPFALYLWTRMDLRNNAGRKASSDAIQDLNENTADIRWHTKLAPWRRGKVNGSGE